MYNILDYLDWRGDLTLDSSPLCEVDSVILARLSYIPFDNIVPKDFRQIITLKEAADKFLSLPDASRKVFLDDDLSLLIKMAHSTRFKDLALCGYINEFDVSSEKQFCALTIKLNDNHYFVSYRGTDNTLVGWKEDFNMSFMCPVPSQESAVIYLESAMESLPGEFIVGGHSKGGNLAIYASAFCVEHMQNRISLAYNFDGPGFQQSIVDSPQYQRICHKTKTFIPHSSIVGLILEHAEEYTTISSSELLGPMQHDVFSWNLMRTEFIKVEAIADSSKFIDSTLKDVLKTLTTKQREDFVDSIYSIFASTGAERLRDIKENPFDSFKSIISSYQEMDTVTKDMIDKTMKVFFKSAKGTFDKMSKK